MSFMLSFSKLDFREHVQSGDRGREERGEGGREGEKSRDHTTSFVVLKL